MLGYCETILILHSLVPLQGAGNVGTHEILTRYIDFFFFISVANSGSIILLWKAFHNSFEGYQDLISRQYTDDEVDSFEEAGAHAQNTLNVTDRVNTLFTEEEKNVQILQIG